MIKLTDAVQADRHTGLIVLRDTLAAALDDPDRPAHAAAPIARQLQAVKREIDELRDPNRPLSKREQLNVRVQRAG